MKVKKKVKPAISPKLNQLKFQVFDMCTQMKDKNENQHVTPHIDSPQCAQYQCSVFFEAIFGTLDAVKAE
jgi:hypothetical protein